MSHDQSRPHRLDETLSRMNIRGLGLWSAGYLTLPVRVLWRERALEERIPGFVRELGRILAVMIRPVPGDFTITEGYNGPREFVDSVAVWLVTFETIGQAANVTYIWICHFWARLLDHALECQPVWTKDDLVS